MPMPSGSELLTKRSEIYNISLTSLCLKLPVKITFSDIFSFFITSPTSSTPRYLLLDCSLYVEFFVWSLPTTNIFDFLIFLLNNAKAPTIISRFLNFLKLAILVITKSSLLTPYFLLILSRSFFGFLEKKE